MRRPASDARLVDLARSGDRRAFALIYERYHRPLLAFCRHLTGQPQDAEDAVQHSFLATFREIESGERPLQLRPWLFQVARNRCLSMRRARRNMADVDAGGEPSTEGLSAEVERRQELRDLVRDLGRLPEQQRSALVLAELHAMPHREIAGLLGVAPDKVKSLVFQARSSLVSSREARDAPCVEVRRQLATLSGSALRRRLLRRHLHDCSGCHEFERALVAQRRALAVVLPVQAASTLRETVLGGAASAGAAGATTGGGAAAGTAAAGAGAGGVAAGAGVAGGPVAALAGKGLVQAAVVLVTVGGGVGASLGGVALPTTSAVPAERQATVTARAEGAASGTVERPAPNGNPGMKAGDGTSPGGLAGQGADGDVADERERGDRPSAGAEEGQPGEPVGSAGEDGQPRGGNGNAGAGHGSAGAKNGNAGAKNGNAGAGNGNARAGKGRGHGGAGHGGGQAGANGDGKGGGNGSGRGGPGKGKPNTHGGNDNEQGGAGKGQSGAGNGQGQGGAGNGGGHGGAGNGQGQGDAGNGQGQGGAEQGGITHGNGQAHPGNGDRQGGGGQDP